MAPTTIDHAGRPLLIFDERGGTGGYWGPVSASIDWCEHNYVVSPYIAEFFNCVSNIGMVLLGLLSMYLNRREGADHRYIVAGSTLAFIGVGSAAFHGTLTHIGQQGDETPMVIGSAVWCWCLIFSDHDFEAQHPRLKVWSAVLIAVLVSVFAVLHYVYSFVALFQVLILVLSLIMIGTLSIKWSCSAMRPALARHFKLYIGTMSTAFPLWLVDQHFCAHLHALPGGVPNPQFHSWWHLLAGANCYLGPLIERAIRLHAHGERPRIAHFLGIVPYVTCAKRA